MNPLVSIIMGSTSDLPVMEEAAKVLNELCIPFEMNALSAHRTPEKVEEFAKENSKVISWRRGQLDAEVDKIFSGNAIGSMNAL